MHTSPLSSILTFRRTLETETLGSGFPVGAIGVESLHCHDITDRGLPPCISHVMIIKVPGLTGPDGVCIIEGVDGESKSHMIFCFFKSGPCIIMVNIWLKSNSLAEKACSCILIFPGWDSNSSC